MELIFHLIILAWATIFADSKKGHFGGGGGVVYVLYIANELCVCE